MATPEMLAKHRVWLSQSIDYPYLFKGYMQAVGFTSQAEGEPDAPYEDSLFEGSGDFDSNWDVWSEIQDHISDEDLQTIMDDLAAFHESATGLVEEDVHSWPSCWDRAGNDFHFTRNGHGCGFWDGDWEEHGQALTDLSKPFSTLEMVGVRDDDGDLHSVYFHC